MPATAFSEYMGKSFKACLYASDGRMKLFSSGHFSTAYSVAFCVAAPGSPPAPIQRAAELRNALDPRQNCEGPPRDPPILPESGRRPCETPSLPAPHLLQLHLIAVYRAEGLHIFPGRADVVIALRQDIRPEIEVLRDNPTFKADVLHRLGGFPEECTALAH